MKQKTSLLKSEAGVIHHLGLIIFAVALVGVIAFAVFRIQGGSQDDLNFGYEGAASVEEDEDLSQAELEEAADEADATVTETDQDTTADSASEEQ